MGFLASIDRALRKPRSALVIAASGAAAAVAVITFVFEKYDLLPNLTFAVLLAGLGIWTVDAWRRLWRVGKGRWEELVFNWGVRRFGLAAWLIFVLTFSLVLAFESQRTWTAFVAVATLFFIYALFTLPAWLWVGYFWGKAMARFLGIEKPVPKRD